MVNDKDKILGNLNYNNQPRKSRSNNLITDIPEENLSMDFDSDVIATYTDKPSRTFDYSDVTSEYLLNKRKIKNATKPKINKNQVKTNRKISKKSKKRNRK